MALATVQSTDYEQRFDHLLVRALPDIDPRPFEGVIVKSITGDSRDVGLGDCFVAVAGTAVDGHDYVEAAVAAGACVVVAERMVPVPAGVMLAVVPDSRLALAKLAAAHCGLDAVQNAGRMRVAGVTGTNGKTTVCYLFRSILGAVPGGAGCALLGTVEINLIGRAFEASLTTAPSVELARYLVEAAECGAKYAVLEASSHALDQRRCEGVRFDAAVFTNLTGDHRDYHPTQDDYCRAKKRLFDSLGPGAWAVVNADDPAGETMLEDCRASAWRFGFGAAADVRGVVDRSDATGSRFRLVTPVGEADVHFPLVGRHNVANALAAAAAALSLGVELDTVRAGLEGASVAPGRLERIAGDNGGPAVLVDYAHTDDALDNVLKAVRPITRGRLIVLFGCGGDRDETKRPRMGRVAATLADEVVVTSDNPRTESVDRIIEHVLAGIDAADRERIHVEPDRQAAIEWAVARGESGDTVLLAGKGHETYQIIGAERRPFDDRVVAANALARRTTDQRTVTP